jgi:GWxTD domain-containing protein
MKRFLILIFISCCAFSSATAQTPFEFTCGNKQPETEKDFNNWIKKEVAYISTEKEKEIFRNLISNKDKIEFINNFWRRRDPTPDTTENEFKTEYCERVKYTSNFDSGIPGWQTDRGLIYIWYGKPDKIERDRKDFENLKNILFEKWFYKYLDVWTDGDFIFLDPTESNEFRLEKGKREELLKNAGSGLKTCFNCPTP